MRPVVHTRPRHRGSLPGTDPTPVARTPVGTGPYGTPSDGPLRLGPSRVSGPQSRSTPVGPVAVRSEEGVVGVEKVEGRLYGTWV